MKVADRFHLTYCSNIHAGETWPEVFGALTHALPEVRRQLAADGPFAIGLRLSARAAETLEQPAELAAFRAFLQEGNYYVPTINGFPYGAFHGERVKERVYQPDWRSVARVDYTNRLASLLAALLDDRSDIEGSVSTVPGAFKPDVRSEEDARAIAAGILRHAAHLVALHERTGVIITLAIEPEPACFIETTAEAIDFFTRFLFEDVAVRAAAQATGVPFGVDEVRRHVGLCFDACHMAVEFEDPASSVKSLEAAGIRICKVQVSSALRVSNPYAGSDARAALGRFAEDTYLHQVVARDGDQLVRYTDLPDALGVIGACASGTDCEWRVHFHVPVFLAALEEFDTTQAYLASVLQLLKRQPVCPYLEVETYTWDVLPPEYKTVNMHTAIARELAWVRGQLEA